MEKLKWEYCECGCKCYVAEGTDLHIYWDLKNKWTLFEGRFRHNVKEFDSQEAAEKDAEERNKLRQKGYKAPIGYDNTVLSSISLGQRKEVVIHLQKMREIAADALSCLDRYSIDCSMFGAGPWYTIEVIWGLGFTPIIDYATRYQEMGDSIHLRVVRNGNVAEATIIHPSERRFHP